MCAGRGAGGGGTKPRLRYETNACGSSETGGHSTPTSLQLEELQHRSSKGTSGCATTSVPLTALLAQTPVQEGRDVGPLLAAELRHQLPQLGVLLKGGRGSGRRGGRRGRGGEGRNRVRVVLSKLGGEEKHSHTFMA
jgi:hypothetical protein